MAKAGILLTPPWPVVSPDEVSFSNMQLLHLSLGRSLSSCRPGQEGGTQELGENSRVTEGSSSCLLSSCCRGSRGPGTAKRQAAAKVPEVP